jgi:putative Holliday junction resolvase
MCPRHDTRDVSTSAAVILESFLNWRAHHPDEEPPELVRPEA